MKLEEDRKEQECTQCYRIKGFITQLFRNFSKVLRPAAKGSIKIYKYIKRKRDKV